MNFYMNLQTSSLSSSSAIVPAVVGGGGDRDLLPCFANDGGGLGPSAESDEGVVFTLALEPILNSFHKEYQMVLTLDHMPNTDPLRRYVRRISPPALSPFQARSVFSSNLDFGCKICLVRYPNCSASLATPDLYMTNRDVPAFLLFLKRSGYVIDTESTRILQHAGIGIDDGYSGNPRHLICSFMRPFPLP